MVYVNVEDKGLIVAIDAKKHEVTAQHPVAPGEEPAGLQKRTLCARRGRAAKRPVGSRPFPPQEGFVFPE